MRKYITAVKRLFHLPLNKADVACLLPAYIYKSRDCKEIELEYDQVKFNYKNKLDLYARLHPHSDLMVMEGVLIREEYLPAVQFVQDNLPGNDSLKIIDAGANVGYTAAYFKCFFPGAQIVCIEPDKNNLKMLRKNIHSFIQDNTVFIYENALMGVTNRSIVLQNNFRDGKDWSINAAESNAETVLKSITIDEIMNKHNWTEVDILKIDIEGAERFIFTEGMALDFLFQVKILVIEIHDEFKIRNQVYSILKKYNFTILNFGEITFGINKIFLNQDNPASMPAFI